MGIINLLDSQTINLIAAGEVVERPASVIKELLENSVDAGSTSVTVEIKSGGVAYMRVSDNGKGMSHEDVLMSTKKHATSKIKSSSDLEAIMTLGFRGEALAAISSVSKFEIISKRQSDNIGTVLELHGDTNIRYEDIGCPDGTTITIKDLFFNLPARRKFLKKPNTENGAISQYVEKIALSHPEISFKYIADGSVKFQTSGDKNRLNAIYSILGREFSQNLIEVNGKIDYVSINGYISKPECSKNNRNFQTFFVNNRFVKSKTLFFGFEDAYKDYIMTEKYPACVLFCEINPHLVDVNVHPSKLEVKFTDEKTVYSAIYATVRTALEKIKNPIAESHQKYTFHEDPPHQERISPPNYKASQSVSQRIKPPENPMKFEDFAKIFNINEYKPQKKQMPEFKEATPVGVVRTTPQIEPDTSNDIIKSISETKNNRVSDYRIVGEIFNTYIIIESGEDFILVDKHAAHERILYEKLKLTQKNDAVQMLLTPVVVNLDRKSASCAEEYIEQIKKTGFDIEPFGGDSFLVRCVPAIFSGMPTGDIEDIVTVMIEDIQNNKKAELIKEKIFDNALHSAACKAAIKAKQPTEPEDIAYLISELYRIGNISYCPHGRPVCKIFEKKDIEKMFFRT